VGRRAATAGLLQEEAATCRSVRRARVWEEDEEGEEDEEDNKPKRSYCYGIFCVSFCASGCFKSSIPSHLHIALAL